MMEPQAAAWESLGDPTPKSNPEYLVPFFFGKPTTYQSQGGHFTTELVNNYVQSFYKKLWMYLFSQVQVFLSFQSFS